MESETNCSLNTGNNINFHIHSNFCIVTKHIEEKLVTIKSESHSMFP